MLDKPFSFEFTSTNFIPTRVDNHIIRRLSDLQGQFSDQQAYVEMLRIEDTKIYEVYEIKRPEVVGEILTGISIVHPGKVGDEFFMTKGHFHSILDTAEIYYCLNGEGLMVMETPEGDTAVEKLFPGRVLYVPPRWAHRSVCTSQHDKLVTFFAYPGHAGHDYGTIEQQGFRLIVVDSGNGIEINLNPKYEEAIV